MHENKTRDGNVPFFRLESGMDLNVSFKDINQHCYEQTKKHLSIVQAYMYGEVDDTIRQHYTSVLHSILNQQEKVLRKFAEERGIKYDVDREIDWVFILRKQIVKLEHPLHN